MSTPRKKSSPKARLKLADRLYIETLRDIGKTAQEIADEIGFDRSTIVRELHRCADGRYNAVEAQRAADHLARRPKPKKLEYNRRLLEYVSTALQAGLPPMEIAKRLKEDFPDDASMRISHESIYKALSGRKERKSETALLDEASNSVNEAESCEGQGDKSESLVMKDIAKDLPEDDAMPDVFTTTGVQSGSETCIYNSAFCGVFSLN